MSGSDERYSCAFEESRSKNELKVKERFYRGKVMPLRRQKMLERKVGKIRDFSLYDSMEEWGLQ